MYRTALRSSPGALRAIRTTPTLTATSRRCLTTAPADKRRTWKGFAARWGVAVAAVYWYNTSPIFADELPPTTVPAPSQFSDSDLPTVEAVIEKKRRETRVSATPASLSTAATPSTADLPSSQQTTALTPGEAQASYGEGSPEALEAEAGQQGAFNPETGEINWDCPCLGGMADGPCGEDFKAAFSCFVFSEVDPKGMDCIDKFQHMQDCFRKYPEIYGAELQDDEDDESVPPMSDAEAPAARDVTTDATTESTVESVENALTEGASKIKSKTEETVQKLRGQPKIEEHGSESEVVPEAAFDATDANKGKKTHAPGEAETETSRRA